jgi:hypothetical protein
MGPPPPHIAIVAGGVPLTRDGHGSASTVPDAEVEPVAPIDQAWSRGLYGLLYAHYSAGKRPSYVCG